MHTTMHYVAIPFSFLLVACSGSSGGPTENEIRQLLQSEIDTMNEHAKTIEGAGRMKTKSMLTELRKVKNHGCVRDGHAYLCDVTIAIFAPAMGEQKRTARLRFVKTDDGWVISE